MVSRLLEGTKRPIFIVWQTIRSNSAAKRRLICCDSSVSTKYCPFERSLAGESMSLPLAGSPDNLHCSIFPATTMSVCYRDLYDRAKLAILVLPRASRNWRDLGAGIGSTIVTAPLPSIGKKRRGWQEEGTWYSPSNGCPCQMRAWSLASQSTVWMVLTRAWISSLMTSVGAPLVRTKQHEESSLLCCWIISLDVA